MTALSVEKAAAFPSPAVGRTVAYPDRNALANIQAGTGISAVERTRLRTAIRDGKLSMILSMTTLEETLGTALRDPEAAIADLRWVVDFTGETRVMRTTAELISQTIQAYATGAPDPDPYSPFNLSGLMVWSPRDLVAEVRMVVHQTRLNGDSFEKGLGIVQRTLPQARHHQGRAP